jgi:hypothetical protein
VNRLTITIITSFVLLACQHTAPAPSTKTDEHDIVPQDNYCHDQETWKEWDDLIRKYPNDRDLQALHALRIGLCIKIDQGSISFEDATDIFNMAHNSVIEKAKKEQHGKKPST